MEQSVSEKVLTTIKTLLGTPADWRLTKPQLPQSPRVNYTWIGPGMALFTIFVGWFAFTKTIGDDNAAFALFIGAVSIMMMTWSNLLSTRLLPLEQIFGGVDRMYVWHRWLGALSVGAMWLHLEMVDDVKGIRGASKMWQMQQKTWRKPDQLCSTFLSASVFCVGSLPDSGASPTNF